MVEVIDHHLLEREPSPSCPVTVETVGSCATLVTERIIQKAPEILDQQVAQLLYGKYLSTPEHIFTDLNLVDCSIICFFSLYLLCVYCILCVYYVYCVCVAAVVLDCVNMAPSAGKVTPKDAQFAAALECRFPALPPRDALFQSLNNAKFDVSGQSQKTVYLYCNT